MPFLIITPDKLDQSAWYESTEWLTFYAELSLLIVAIIGVWLTWHSIQKSRETAKKTKSIEIIMDAERTLIHENGMSVLKKYDNSKKYSINVLGKNKTKNKKLKQKREEDKQDLYNLLNYMEYLAIAIRQDSIDENTIRKASYSTVTYAFEASLPLIIELRRRLKKRHMFAEYEWLYHRWVNVGYKGKLPKLD